MDHQPFISCYERNLHHHHNNLESQKNVMFVTNPARQQLECFEFVYCASSLHVHHNFLWELIQNCCCSSVLFSQKAAGRTKAFLCIETIKIEISLDEIDSKKFLFVLFLHNSAVFVEAGWLASKQHSIINFHEDETLTGDLTFVVIIFGVEIFRNSDEKREMKKNDFCCCYFCVFGSETIWEWIRRWFPRGFRD